MARGSIALTATCLLALLVAPFAVDARDLQQTSTTCVVASSAKLVITAGEGSARSNALCTAEAKAESDIKEAVDKWVDQVIDNEEEGCSDLAASELVEGWATALATAFASVSNEVYISGTGTACAEATADGDAFALALVEITVNVTLQAIQDSFGDDLSTKVDEAIKKGTNEATGEAVGVALGGAIAEAWASASNRVCTSQGRELGFDESEATQIVQAEAFLFAEVILTVCSELGVELDSEFASSLADSQSFVTGAVEKLVVQDTTTGTASTGTSDFKQCAGQKGAICCSTSSKAQPTCSCGSGCTMEEVTVTSAPSAAAKVWQDSETKEFCFCT